MIRCTVLNPALDVTYEVSDLAVGSTYTHLPAMFTPGGKGLNVARVAVALGEQASALCIMPRESRAMYESFIETIGVSAAFMDIPGSVRVNTTIADRITGNITHLNARGAILQKSLGLEIAAFISENSSSGEIWSLSGSLPEGVSSDLYEIIIRDLKTHGNSVLLDSSSQSFSMGIRARPDMVKPNQRELEAFVGEELKGIRHIAFKGKRLLDLGVCAVFISLGSDGMIAIQGNDCLLCSAPAVKTVDTVGCGDALVAGLLIGRKRSYSLSETCRLAIACGVSNALHFGPGVVDKNEVWSLMEEVKIEAV